jgi:hypothetical protein
MFLSILLGTIYAVGVIVMVISSKLLWWLVVLGHAAFIALCVLLFMGMEQTKAASNRKREELRKNGVRCWGRIVSSATTGDGRSVGAMSWWRTKIEVDAFATYDPNETADYRQNSAGIQVPDRVVIDWYISMLQSSLVQPSYYCAFRLDPSDPTNVWLDALANPEGQIILLT